MGRGSARRLLVVGAGGHGQVVAAAAQAATRQGTDHFEVIGFVDDDPDKQGQLVLGLPVLGPVQAALTLPLDAIAIGVGSNSARKRLFAWALAQGVAVATVIHPQSLIAPDVVPGEGTFVAVGAILQVGAHVGRNVILNSGCCVEHHNVISDHVHLGPRVTLGGDVTVGEGALIGIGATVMPQLTVGAWSVVGAGALVHRSVAPGVTVVGTPARLLARPSGSEENGKPASE